MKTACVAILLFGSLTTVLGWGFENYGEAFMKCLESDTPDKITVQIRAYRRRRSFVMDDSPRPRGQNLWSCVFEYYGIMKDEKFVKEGYVKMIEKENKGDFDEDERVAKAQEVADACEAKIGAGGATPEETAQMIHQCLMEAHYPSLDFTAELEQRQKCMTEEKVEMMDILEMKANGKLANNDGIKRLTRCLFTAQGVMRNGKFDKEGYLAMIEEKHKRDDYKDKKLAIAEDMANVCIEKIGTRGDTPEDKAKDIHDCLAVETTKRGILPL